MILKEHFKKKVPVTYGSPLPPSSPAASTGSKQAGLQTRPFSSPPLSRALNLPSCHGGFRHPRRWPTAMRSHSVYLFVIAAFFLRGDKWNPISRAGEWQGQGRGAAPGHLFINGVKRRSRSKTCRRANRSVWCNRRRETASLQDWERHKSRCRSLSTYFQRAATKTKAFQDAREKITLREVCHNLTIILQKKIKTKKKNLERGKDFKEAYFTSFISPSSKTHGDWEHVREWERFGRRVSS